MIWDGASTKSALGLGAAEARELGVREAHVQDVAELVEQRLDLAVRPVAQERGPLAAGGVKFATMAFTGCS